MLQCAIEAICEKKSVLQVWQWMMQWMMVSQKWYDLTRPAYTLGKLKQVNHSLAKSKHGKSIARLSGRAQTKILTNTPCHMIAMSPKKKKKIILSAFCVPTTIQTKFYDLAHKTGIEWNLCNLFVRFLFCFALFIIQIQLMNSEIS